MRRLDFFSCCGGGNARQFSDFGNLLRQIFRVGILVNLPITSAHVQIGRALGCSGWVLDMSGNPAPGWRGIWDTKLLT